MPARPLPSSAAEQIAAANPLRLAEGALQRVLCLSGTQPVDVDHYLREVNGLAQLLAEQAPEADHLLNLCENRYRFLVLFGAALALGLPSLLPPSRAANVVGEMLQRYPRALAVGDDQFPGGVSLQQRPERYVSLPNPLPQGAALQPPLSAGQLAVIGFTSGSSGPPKPHSRLVSHAFARRRAAWPPSSSR